MKQVGFDKGGKVQKRIDSFVLYESEPYEPGNHIHKAGVIGTKIGSGKVIWNSVDSEYLYNAKLMVDPKYGKGAFFSPNYGYWSRPGVQKVIDPNGRNLEFHGGGNRGSKWFDRMINDKMDDLLKEIQDVIK